MGRDLNHRRSIIVSACFIAALCGRAHADTRLTVEAGAGHSDNITRTEGEEVDETIASLGVDLEWQAERPRLTADVNLNADYLEYLDDTFDSEVVGAGNALLNFALVPERLNWTLEDHYGQQSNDPFSPITPETRESVNYLSTGPDLLLRFGDAGVRLFGQYSLATYERSPVDNERLVGGLSLGRAGVRGQGLSFNAVQESVAFDDLPANDFDRRSAYLAYGISGARTELRIEGGYTWLEPEQGEESGAPRVLVQVDRELTRSSTLTLVLGTQLTDSSAALSSAVDGPVPSGPTVTATADPFENRNASLSWRFARRRTSIALGVDWDDEQYETQPLLDRTRTSFDVALDRRLGARLSAGLSASLIDEDFDAANFDARTRELAASLSWQAGRAIGLRLVAERSSRDTSTGLGEYGENRVFLRVFYIATRGTPDGGAAP
jgi:hypothetical protein